EYSPIDDWNAYRIAVECQPIAWKGSYHQFSVHQWNHACLWIGASQFLADNVAPHIKCNWTFEHGTRWDGSDEYHCTCYRCRPVYCFRVSGIPNAGDLFCVAAFYQMVLQLYGRAKKEEVYDST